MAEIALAVLLGLLVAGAAGFMAGVLCGPRVALWLRRCWWREGSSGGGDW